MTESIFRDLQERLDFYSLGFPKTESGIERKILQRLFSESDAKMFLDMTPRLEDAASVAARVERPEADVAAHLEDMARRGLLFRQKKGDVARYGAIPFVHGLFEFQVKRLDRAFAELVETYFKERFLDNFHESGEAFLRVIPVQQSVDVKHNVASFEDAVQLLEHADNIVVTDCICRKHQSVIGQSCGKPLEACFMFGSMGQYYLDHDMGRKVDVAEAIQLVQAAQDAGLVTQPATAQNPGGMCNCCGDCCGVLRSINRYPKPAEIVFSNHFAVVDAEACTGCETCLERCQMGALAMNDDEIVEINLDRCIGCGLCVTTCPADALSLVPKAADRRRLPPATTADQMQYMARKRGLI